MDTEEARGLEFPCRFPIKIMGQNDGGFEAYAVSLVSTHVGPVPPADVETRPSRNGRFLSVTVSVHLDSRAQLEAIYRDLAASSRVLMAL